MEWLRRILTCLTIFSLLYGSCSLLAKRSPFDIFSDGLNSTALSNEQLTVITSSFISLPILLFFAYALGEVFEMGGFPGLIGMFLAGFTLSQPIFRDKLLVDAYASTVLRKLAFIVILVRGGLSLDAKQLKKWKATCLTLSVVPCIFEILIVAGFSMFFLGIDLMSGLALGALLSAVSPAVVVPCMLEVQRKGYGNSNGVSTLIIASATVNDVFSVTLFTILMGMIFGTGRSTLSLVLHAPIEVALGIVIGLVGGCAIVFITKFDSPHISLARTLCLLLCSVCALFGSAHLGSESMGAVAVLSLAFVTSQRMWKLTESLSQIKYHLDVLWKFAFQQFLFALIGFMFDVSQVQYIFGCLIVAIGTIMRTAITFCVVHGGLSLKERFFVAIAWIPKATVQAALAPAFLEMATSTDQSLEKTGQLVMMVGVASIFLTAPVGAALIRILTPKFLNKDVILVSEDEQALQDIVSK